MPTLVLDNVPLHQTLKEYSVKNKIPIKNLIEEFIKMGISFGNLSQGEQGKVLQILAGGMLDE